MKFAATFTPGVSELVVRHLKSFPLEKVHASYHEDGLVVGETAFSLAWLREVRFWHNVFVVVGEASHLSGVDALIACIKKRELQRLLKALFPKAQTMQLRVLDQGQPIALPAHHRRGIERLMVAVGLQAVSHHADLEIWLVRRASGYGFIGVRLSRPHFKRRVRDAGELRPELVHLLGMAAGVTGRDILLDPFAGHGGIPRELVAGFSPRKMIALEQDPRLVGKLRALAKEKASLQVMSGNALEMREIPSGSVNRIITDPPWGEYRATTIPLPQFYTGMLDEFARVLKPGGIAVVVSGAKEAFLESAVHPAFEIIRTYHILVSGKKAVIVKLRRRPHWPDTQ